MVYCNDILSFNLQYQKIMSQKISIKNSTENHLLRCEISIHDSSLIGKEIFISLASRVKVKDPLPVHSIKTYETQDIVVHESKSVVYFDIKKYQAFSYEGEKIDIEFFIHCEINDSILFNTIIQSNIQDELLIRPKIWGNIQEIIEPKDIFSFVKNMKAIPYKARIFVVWLSILGWILITINMIIGIHDQFSPHSQVILYWVSDSDDHPPLFKALALNWFLWATIFAMIKTQLRRYMSFFFKKDFKIRERNASYRLSEMLWGKPRVDLHNITLRIVAWNFEEWQYERKEKDETQTISFSHPIRALIIHTQKIDFIPRWADISSYFTWEVSFEEMYRVLYPHAMISETHWLKFHFEVQLIHNDFIDQELKRDIPMFPYKYFLEA